MQIAPRIWRIQSPLRLTGAAAFTYPANSRVTAIRTDAGIIRCRRDALPSMRQGPARGEIIPCLGDGDGDGLFERADLHRAREFMAPGRARIRVARSVALAPPVWLVEDAAGLAHWRSHAWRRLRVASVSGAEAELVVEHARVYTGEGRADSALLPRRGPPARLEKAEPPPDDSEFVRFGRPHRVRLADGATVEAGGLRLRVGRSPAGWTLTPLADRFAPWIRAECDGAHVRIGIP